MPEDWMMSIKEMNEIIENGGWHMDIVSNAQEKLIKYMKDNHLLKHQKHIIGFRTTNGIRESIIGHDKELCRLCMLLKEFKHSDENSNLALVK